MKKCIQCKRLMDDIEFHIDRHDKSGRKRRCKTCCAENLALKKTGCAYRECKECKSMLLNNIGNHLAAVGDLTSERTDSAA